MTKRITTVMISLLLLTSLLTACKLPASRAPEETQPAMTTPILFQTDSPPFQTQTALAKLLPTNASGGIGTPAPTPTLTPEPTEVIAIPTLTRPAQYVLQEGEFPYCIARRFNLNPADLLNLNNLGPNQLVSPGTTLQIPQTGVWAGEGRVRNAHPDTYTVSAGETIYSIACYYGDVSPEAIAAVNRLESPFKLTPGQQLNIP